MLRNTFFALMAVLTIACSSQAAVILEQSAATDLGSGLVSYKLNAVSDAGEVLNGVGDPSIVANDGGAGLHQVWLNNSGNFKSPTAGDHTVGLWNDAYTPFDTFFNFNTTNSLSTGANFDETNNFTDGVAGLPAGALGAPATGFGTFGTVGGSSGGKLFTVASGLAGNNIELGQLVMKANESVLVSMQVLSADGIGGEFTDFCVGACDPQTGTPPVVDPLNFPNVNAATAGLLSGTVTQTGGDPVPTWDGFTFLGYTPNYGGSGDGATVAGSAGFDEGNQLFSWNPLNAPRGDYVWQVTATNSAGSDDGLITVNVTAVPEPSTMALCGLAFVGVAGLIRRRNG